MDLSGRVALVTGSARRLGRAIARGLAEAGVHIAVHYHAAQEQAEQADAEFRDLGVQSAVFQADLTDPTQISKLFADIEGTFGRLDILVNSAAIFEHQPILAIEADTWDHVMNLNLRAPFLCCQHAAGLMGRSGEGRIINIADVAAYQPWPGYAPYAISKAGLVMLTKLMARALAPDVLVNAVAPGPVLPPDDLTPEERRRLAAMTPLQRLGEPADVVRAVLFLAEANYITGETIVVDGGKLLRT
jgi:pteridine reductase